MGRHVAHTSWPGLSMARLEEAWVVLGPTRTHGPCLGCHSSLLCGPARHDYQLAREAWLGGTSHLGHDPITAWPTMARPSQS
jgi:hypothetical protein